MEKLSQRHRVELLLAKPTVLPRTAFQSTLGRLLPDVDTSGVHIEEVSNEVGASGATHVALSQTWDWPDAERALHEAQASLSVEFDPDTKTDRFARLHQLNATLRALLEHLPVVALHWSSAQRLIDPQAFIASLAHGGTVTDHAVNVRLFHISDGRDGELLMDTLGLGAFGLPDLQCHFAGADPARMGALLAGYAHYLFDKGDVLNDDSLVRGIESYDEWPCQREESLAKPARPVVDIRPDKLWVPT